MVKDHSDSERGNLLLPLHGLFFFISSKGSFICTIPQTGEHIRWPLLHQSWSTGWNEKKLNGSTMRDRSNNPLHHKRTIYQGVTSRSPLLVTWLFVINILTLLIQNVFSVSLNIFSYKHTYITYIYIHHTHTYITHIYHTCIHTLHTHTHTNIYIYYQYL